MFVLSVNVSVFDVLAEHFEMISLSRTCFTSTETISYYLTSLSAALQTLATLPEELRRFTILESTDKGKKSKTLPSTIVTIGQTLGVLPDYF